VTTLIGENAGWSKRARGSTRERFSPSRALSEVWALQRDRWILWLPVGIIAGAAIWLLAPAEPVWWLGFVVFACATLAAFALHAWPGEAPSGWLSRMRLGVAGLLALLAAAGLGAIAAQVRTAVVAAPAYVGGVEPVRIEGWVVANNAGERGPRLRLLVRNIEGVESAPRYVRVSVSEAGLLTPGRAARCRAVIGPPAAAMAPGAYDFARRLTSSG
jgi:competence protein ComEC